MAVDNDIVEPLDGLIHPVVKPGQLEDEMVLRWRPATAMAVVREYAFPLGWVADNAELLGGEGTFWDMPLPTQKHANLKLRNILRLDAVKAAAKRERRPPRLTP